MQALAILPYQTKGPRPSNRPPLAIFDPKVQSRDSSNTSPRDIAASEETSSKTPTRKSTTRKQGNGRRPPSSPTRTTTRRNSKNGRSQTSKWWPPFVLGGAALLSGAVALFSYLAGDKFIQNDKISEWLTILSSTSFIFFGALFGAERLSPLRNSDDGNQHVPQNTM